MKSNLIDRFTVSFYEEAYIDKLLLHALNKVSVPRYRGNKIKEWAYEYLRSNPELFKELENEIKNSNKEEKIINTQAKDLIDLKEQQKKKLKGNLNIVTSD